MNHAPLVRLILPFLAGIIAAIYLGVPSVWVPVTLILFFLFISILLFAPWRGFSYKKRWVFGILVNFILFFGGYELTVLKTEKYNTKHFSNFGTNGRVCVKILQPYVEKNKTLKVPVEVIAFWTKDKIVQTKGKLMLYLQKDSISLKIKYGDCLLINGNFIPIPPPQNPAEFNYKNYLAFHNIYHQSYVASGKWKMTGINEGNFILRMAIDLRNKLLNIFQENKVKGDDFAVGSALLLGYEDKLDADIIAAYSGTGALHVLSVSGMHVALVYMVFFYLLFFLNNIKHGNIIKAVCLLLFLWFYATLTGLSPSVLRAATMFSFIIIGKAFKFQSNIYNALAASAFFLLIIDPFLIMEVGFQLSYLAVIGIVFIHPLIYEKLQPSNRLLEKVWAIISISIAAQLATFPLGLHYFHQFPNYFIFSNLVVIPLSSAIIYAGILLFFLSGFLSPALFVGHIFSALITFLNNIVRFIDQLPNALIEGISINVFETWLIYFTIAFFFAFFILKKAGYLISALSLVVIILFLQLIEKVEQHDQQKLIVYNIPGTTACDLISGNTNYLFADSSLIENKSSMLFHIKHNWWENGLKTNNINNIKEKGVKSTGLLFCHMPFVKIENIQIAFFNKNYCQKCFKKKTNVDYVIVGKNVVNNISDIISAFSFKKLIFDSSNDKWMVQKWKKQCSLAEIDYYDVTEKGAFIASFK